MEKDKNKKLRKGFKIAGITIGSVLGVAVLTVGSYAIYCFAQYSRIEDNQVLEIKNPVTSKASVNQELSVTSFNIGFGAYSYDFDFCLDRGVDPDGTERQGTHAKGKTKEEVQRNTTGCINALKSIQSDFICLQEVDTHSDRSRFINQVEQIGNEFNTYSQSFASNFHTAWFIYPVNDPIGASNSGIQFLSKYQVDESIRRSYPVTENAFDALFDLDRCFMVQYLPLENSDHQLILINSHMSAYDEGGVIRNAQLRLLNGFMKQEREKGNYVIAAGDFNHDLLTYNPLYNFDLNNRPYQYEQLRPYWIASMFDENGKNEVLDERFSVHASSNAPTCRGVDQAYKEGFTYVSTVDGFIISDNVECIEVQTTPLPLEGKTNHFAFADHQPTTMKFKLKA